MTSSVDAHHEFLELGSHSDLNAEYHVSQTPLCVSINASPFNQFGNSHKNNKWNALETGGISLRISYVSRQGKDLHNNLRGQTICFILCKQQSGIIQ